MPRTCARDGCSTVLSTYNKDAYCMPCQDSGRVPEEGKIQLCKICGATIHGRQTWARYCSEECREEGTRRNNQAYRRRSGVQERATS